MKKTVKYSAIILSIVLSFFAIVSCTETKTEEVFDESFIDESAEIVTDLQGRTVRFVSGWLADWVSEVGFSVRGDNQLDRYKKIENEFNCTIDFSEVTSGSAASYVMTHVASQVDIPDFIDFTTENIYSLYEADMLLALDDVEGIDLTDEKWGNWQFIRYGRFDGKQYGFYTYDWQFPPEINGVCTFDSYVVGSLGLDNPHEMLENGKWTWNEFEKLLDKATVQDGEKTVHGLSFVESDSLMKAAIFSNGGEIVSENSNGTKTSALKSQNVIEAVEWVADLYGKGYTATYTNEMFNNHEAAFFVGESWYFVSVSEYHQGITTPVYGHTGYGFVPFPTGPKGEYGVGGQFVFEGRRLNWIVDATTMDNADIGSFLNAFTEPMEGTNKKAWVDFNETNVFFYRGTDSDIFVNMVESVFYDWSAELGDADDTLSGELAKVLLGKESAASAIDAIDIVVTDALN